MASPEARSSHSRARALIERIAKDHGFLSEEVLRKINDADTRREVEQALLRKDELIGSSVITLAKNLYSKDFRFVFELLQNADDNSYQRATKDGKDPYVLFRMYSDRIVVDCNEDGFTEENLRAICSIGKSSKLGAQGYIGEKGIGFKSVFKIASKVHIQSEPYSFRFCHRRGESGMGMISPEWEDSSEQLDGPLTRITLFLHDDGSPASRASQQASIVRQFGDLQPEMLLFLNKLRRIEVQIFDDSPKEAASVTLLKSERGSSNLVILLKEMRRNGRKLVSRTKQQYLVFKNQVHGLEKNENRTYSADEEEGKAYGTAEVVIAFPLSDQSEPLVQPQELFAFLPVRRVGFNFLLHSDFVTGASREDIITTSPRNQSLLDGIADTFVLAVEQLCQHPQLRFTWMRYLPDPKPQAWDAFWKQLVDKLKTKISRASVLVPRSFQELRSPLELRLLGPAVDQYDEPLFDDLDGPSAVYLSPNYLSSDLKILESFGLQEISLDELLIRASADLSKDTSRMRSPETEDDWHSCVATMLLIPFETECRDQVEQVKRLALLPLCDGTWVRSPMARGLPRYFPSTSDGNAIPKGLGLSLLDTKAVGNQERKKLFETCGVRYASNPDVRTRIFQRYRASSRDTVSLDESLAMLHFLYQTHSEKDSANTYSAVGVLTSEQESVDPRDHDVYFAEGEPLRLSKLGLPLVFIHPDYMEKFPPVVEGTTPGGLDWRKWLHDFVGVREHMRLMSPDGSCLSAEWTHVRDFIPKQALQFLYSLWPYEKDGLWENFGLRQDLRESLILCRDGSLCKLEATFLPTSRLNQISCRFLRGEERMPFLHLDRGLLKSMSGQWSFCSTFGVGDRDTYDFYTKVLSVIVDANPDGSVEAVSRVLELYILIGEGCTRFDGFLRNSAIEHCRNMLPTLCVFIPKSDCRDGGWYAPEQCRLGAPEGLLSKPPVDAVYKIAFAGQNIPLEPVFSFFRDVLSVPQYTWDDLINDLHHLKDMGNTDAERIRELYRKLAEDVPSTSKEDLRNVFESDALIFISAGAQGGWYKTADCIWSSGTEIQSKANIAHEYADLETFFVNALRIKSLSISMVYNELASVGSRRSEIGQVKSLLWSLNSLLLTEPLGQDQQPERLLQGCILPVRNPNGEVGLQSSATFFTIVDRKHLEEAFSSQVEILDFSMNEIRRLEPFLKWASLENRYLSRVVHEVAVLESRDTHRVSEPRFDIKRKAHALLRIATHFKSPRIVNDGQALYDILRTSETLETDGISSELRLTMDGRTITVKTADSEVYITEAAGSLTVYIPRDDGAQDVCIQHALPQKLVEWLMTSPGHAAKPNAEAVQVDGRAVSVMKGLLNAKIRSVGMILDKEGIIDIDLPDLPDLDVEDGEKAPASVYYSSTVVADQEDSITTQDTGRLYSGSGGAGLRGWTPSPQELSFEDVIAAAIASSKLPDDRYCEFLSHVVTSARGLRFLNDTVAESSEVGSLDLSTLSHALPGLSNGTSGRVFDGSLFWGMSQAVRDVKVGAAGELFVFELLSAIRPKLPGFSLKNWPSTVRSIAAAHPEYASMPPWHGVETTDLEYADSEGVFTSLLIASGYLSRDNWQNKCPKYYIEVKSTTSSCNIPFYVSGKQYQKMKQCHASDDAIYVVFRVHDMNTSNINAALYVDPIRLQREGRLEFGADKYAVTPESSALVFVT